MIYRKYGFFLFIRLLILLGFLTALAFSVSASQFYPAVAAGILSLLSFYNLYRFNSRRFSEINDFFEAVKYRDFSRWFVEDRGPRDIRKLHSGFNEVNRTIREINSEKDTQYVYLQKILEMVQIGIIAYNRDTGKVLWANDAIKDTLDFPSIKNISFVARRNPELYKSIFEASHSEANSITLNVKDEKIKVLVSETVFNVKEESFRLLVLHNIDETLNRNEADAWKKLLSVMTHEIMNSIAPISSLADTLQSNVRLVAAEGEPERLNLEDLDMGITSIKKRSEGLMKFAKTYRSLNKVTHINREKVKVMSLFQNLQNLLAPSLREKNVQVDFLLDNPDLEVQIDTYLIEQVLINLLLNALDAVKDCPDPQITVIAKKNLSGDTIIQVTDNGKGIPAEIADSIFVPFFTTKKNGSGIGLSLCKQIMMLHRGKIQMNSEEGKGAVVTLSF